jgi:AmmeMemoRadiSam system protein A
LKASHGGDALSERPRAALLPPPVEISDDDGGLLLHLARQAVVATVGGRVHSFDPSDLLPRQPTAALLAPAAAFVTLREGGELRGCIGTLATDRPLWKSVISAAISAASHDPRFPPVAAHELPSLTIDVSVLGPAIPLEDPVDFQPGVHGLIVERGLRRGLLLPEVATEQGWAAREMLAATCWKAGLPMSAWHDPETRVLAFCTARLSEAETSAHARSG